MAAGFVVAGLALHSTGSHAACADMAEYEAAANALRASAPGLLKAMQRDPPSGVTCSSLRTVFKELLIPSKNGKHLDELKPLDEAAARKELDEARQEAALQAPLKQLMDADAEDTVKKIYEAALMDANDHYAARKLLVQQVRVTAGISK
jgi:hypothetical protein